MKIALNRNNILYLVLYIIFSTIMFMFYKLFDTNVDNKIYLAVICWFVNFVFLFSFWITYKFEDSSIELSNLCLIVAFLFNFGQTFMWSIGIHNENEIGQNKLFSNYLVPSVADISKAVLYGALSFTFLTLGILFGKLFKSEEKERNSLEFEVIYKVSVVLAVVIIPLTFAKVFITLKYSATYGYVNLYYSDFAIPVVLDFAERMFFPILVGLLLGSDYKKIRIVYSIFAIFVIVYLFAGERGNWFYDFLILFWMHNRFYKKINVKKMIKVGGLAFIFLYFIAVIVDLRGSGLKNIDFGDVQSSLALGRNPFVRFIMEMGGSLAVIIVVMGFGREVFNFPNTFLTSALSSVSSTVAASFGLTPVYLSNFLSQGLLKITYGTGFNFFAESYINGSFIYTFLYGIIIAIFVTRNGAQKNGEISFKDYTACIVMPAICSSFRGESLSTFKSIMQTGILYPIIILIICKIVLSKSKKIN